MREVRKNLTLTGSEEENLGELMDRIFLTYNSLIGIEEKLIHYRESYREYRNEVAYGRKTQVDSEYDKLGSKECEESIFEGVKEIFLYEGCLMEKMALCERLGRNIDHFAGAGEGGPGLLVGEEGAEDGVTDCKVLNILIGNMKHESECLLKRSFIGLGVLNSNQNFLNKKGPKGKYNPVRTSLEKLSENIYSDLRNYDTVFKAKRMI